LPWNNLSNQTGDARYPLSTALYRAVFGTTPAIAENSASYATGTLAPDMIAYGEGLRYVIPADAREVLF